MSTAIYARVSTDSDDQANALEQQLERLRKACPDALEYVDIQSGTATDRPQWEALMDGCRDGAINRVVATRLDRISRSRVGGAQTLQFFMRPQAPTLELLDDSLNLATSGGRFMADLLIAWAVSESERLGERTRHGHAHRRSLNKPFGPKPPIGYVYTEGKANYALDPAVAPGAKQVVDFFLSGQGGLRSTVQYAQREHGITFASHSSLKRWLLNPTLAGFRTYGVSTVEVLEDGTKKRRHNRPGVYGEVIPDSHPALISEATHARLVAMFEGGRDQRTMPVKEGRVRPMTGLSRCATCGNYLHVHYSGSRRWYRCGNDQCSIRYRNRIPEDDLREAVIDAVRSLAKQVSDSVVAQMDSDDEPEDVIELRGKIATLRATGLEEVRSTVLQMEKLLDLKLKQQDPKKTSCSNETRIALERLIEVPGLIEGMPPENQRVIFQECIREVLVEKGKIVEVQTKPIR